MIASAFALEGRRILVTGGTRGIGRAISLHLARCGADVVAAYGRNDVAAESLVREVSAEGKTVTICRGDLAGESGVAKVLETVNGLPISAFVHCAATGVHGPIEALTLRHWEFTFAVNLRAFFSLVKGLLPQLARGASVIALSSHGAAQAFPNYALVGATKGGLESLCRHLAVELAPRGVRVNVLSPGSVITEAWDAFPDKDARIREALERSPRGRLTTVEEVANAAHFLCCDASLGLSGHTLIVDGGERAAG